MAEFKPFFIARRIENRILIGLACATATIILIGWIAINENARMDEFTERAEARSIEQGARIFESNCSACHGTDGLGLAGVAPALNSPQLFSYNFFASIDNELILTNSQLSSSTNPDEREALRVRVAELEAERLALEEKILYDWTDRLAELDAQLTAVDAQVLELGGVDNASRLPIYISQIEAEQLAPLLAEQADLMAKAEAAAAPAEGEAAPAEGEAAPAEGEAAQQDAGVPGLSEEEVARLAELEAGIAAVEDSLAPYKALKAQRDALVAERSAFLALADAQAAMESKRAELAAAEMELLALGEPPAEGEDDPNADQRLELNNQAAMLRSDLDNLEITRNSAYDALVEAGYILDYDPNAPGRLAEVGWAGSLYDFVEGTLTGGRPTSASYWPQPMVAWSQLAGGPLRPDQIRNLTTYVLNWEREFTIEDLRAVRQFPRIPGTGGGAAENAIGSDNVALIEQEIAAQLEAAEITPGDPTAGQSVFTNLGCGGCHGQAPGTGPALTGLWTRTTEDQDGRLTNTGYVDNPQAYLIQSIVNPGAYVVPGFSDGVMPKTFKDQLDYQGMVNILAYLEAQTQ